MTDPSDGEIVRRVLDGDIDLFRLLVARYRQRLSRFAVHMLGDLDEAEDALQESFVRAYRSLDRCRDPERFDAWFFRILANRCRTRGARLGLRSARFVRDDEAMRQAAAPAPEDADLGEAHRALQNLDAESRQVFLMKHVEELSYPEISRLTGIGISALKMRVSRACERLRHEMQEDLHDA